MKKLVFPFVIALFVSFLSCESETIETPADNLADLKTTTNIQNRNATDVFANSLQWSTFVIAEMLLETPSYKDYIISHFQGDPVVNFNDLLEDTSVEGVQFRDDFEVSLEDWLTRNDDKQEDRPKRPVGGNDDSGNGNDLGPTLVDTYLDYMLNDNCVEILLIDHLNIYGDIIYTTGHPLDPTEVENDGFKLEKTFSGNVASSPEIISETNTINNDAILLARPYKTSGAGKNNPCRYLQYGLIDFEDFLDF